VTRPPLHKIEKFFLVVIVAHLGFLAWSLVVEPETFIQGGVLLRLVLVLLVLLCVVAFALIATRSPSGLVVLMFFYAPQLPYLEIDGETVWMFSFSPTYFRGVFAGDTWQLRVNLVALLLFAICFPAWQMRRKANVTGVLPAYTGGA
jgi:hypothetical protein